MDTESVIITLEGVTVKGGPGSYTVKVLAIISV